MLAWEGRGARGAGFGETGARCVCVDVRCRAALGLGWHVPGEAAAPPAMPPPAPRARHRTHPHSRTRARHISAHVSGSRLPSSSSAASSASGSRPARRRPSSSAAAVCEVRGCWRRPLAPCPASPRSPIAALSSRRRRPTRRAAEVDGVARAPPPPPPDASVGIVSALTCDDSRRTHPSWLAVDPAVWRGAPTTLAEQATQSKRGQPLSKQEDSPSEAGAAGGESTA